MLRDNFNPEKFIEQCKAHAIRCGYPNEAEDFAQFAFLKVWQYQHFQPMTWTWSGYLRGRFGNTHSEIGRIKSFALRHESNGDELLTDESDGTFLDQFCAAPEPHQEEREELSPKEEFFRLLIKTPSNNTFRKLRKTLPYRTEEWTDFRESLEPLVVDWIQL